jgi:hypothetical protein
MTWLDVWYGFVAGIVAAIGHWLIDGVLLGIGHPIAWSFSAVGAFVGMSLGRPAWRAFANSAKAKR